MKLIKLLVLIVCMTLVFSKNLHKKRVTPKEICENRGCNQKDQECCLERGLWKQVKLGKTNPLNITFQGFIKCKAECNLEKEKTLH